MRKRLLLAVIVISISGLVVIGQVEQPEPMPGTYVHDFAGVISVDKKAEIQSKAQRLKDEFKTEVALVTIDSLQGEDSFDYSMRMARSWGIGSPDNEIRGLLIVVAVKDRKTSFRTSRHIEGEIPDAVTHDVSQTMNLYFKRGDFGGGLSAGLDKIVARLQGVYEPSAATPPQEESSGWVRFWLILWAGVAVFIVIGAVRKKRRERVRQEAAARQPKRRPAARGKGVKSKKGKSSSRTSESSGPSSTYDSGYSSSWSSSSSYGSGSSSSSDSGSSYSGGSDFGGGGSDSSW